MASLLVCLPSNTELRSLALTYDCVQKMRRWRRLEGGTTELQDVISTLGCVNYHALQSNELENLLKLLALHFEEALLAIRRRSVSPSEADFCIPFSRTGESDVKPYVDDDLNPGDLDPHKELTITTYFENKDAPTHLPSDKYASYICKSPILEFGDDEHVGDIQPIRKLEKNYACSVCPKRFTVAKALYRHEKRAHGSHGKANDEVGKPFSVIPAAKENKLEGDSESLIKAHSIEPGTKAFKNDASPPETMDKTNSCRVCSKTFASASSAERHERRVHRDRKNKRDQPEKDVEITANTVATEGRTKDCSSEEPTTLDSLVQSLNLPVEEYVAEGYGSEPRERGDDTIEAIRATVLTSSIESGVAVIDKNIRSADLGAAGVLVATTPTKNLCPICGAQFCGLAELQQHESEAHDKLGSANDGKALSRTRKRRCRTFVDESKPVFECNHCGKQFKDKHYLRKHDNIHTRSRLYVCHLCGKSFNQNSGLYTHKKLHLDNAPFKCDVEGCRKSFTTKNSLISHTSEHTGIRPFICEVCQKAFGNRRTLLRHRETHFEMSKAFHCSYCAKAFRRKADVDIHERIHTGIKPFICSFSCGRAFTQKQSLTEHERIHKGERPFACDQCGKSFTQKSTLTKHKSTHKLDDPDSQQIDQNP